MARLILQLKIDPVSKKREVFIGYESEGDALPMEHEADHRAMVQQVAGAAGGGATRVAVNEGLLQPASAPPASGGIEQKS
ncbi:MAG: hypothetical protein EXR69_05940 [Myxococcales bacterium]|nr:hypothetical protein [Myxococcales bacterium]